MQISELVKEWERSGGGQMSAREFRLHLPVRDAAKIAALVDMYPLRSETEIISELLSAALDELERAMPYVKGSKVIAVDDQGDAMFEDIGPTPRFNALCKQYRERMENTGEPHSG